MAEESLLEDFELLSDTLFSVIPYFLVVMIFLIMLYFIKYKGGFNQSSTVVSDLLKKVRKKTKNENGRKEKMEKMNKKEIGIVVVVVSVVLAIVMGFFSIKIVKPNEVAIKVRLGEVVGKETSGIHIELPFVTSYKKIEISQQKYEGVYSTSTRDMQTVSQKIATQYTINIEKVEELYLKFLGKHEESIVAPAIAETIQSVTSQYTIEEFVAKRTEISELMTTNLKDKLSEYGIYVISVDILDHDFSDTYEKAIEEKKVAEQKVQQAQFEQQTAEIEAQTNKIKSESITENIKYKMFIEKWNGILPLYLSDEGINLFIPAE